MAESCVAALRSRMEGGSSSSAASAASVEQVKVWLRIAGQGSAAQFEGPTNVGLFLNAVVDAKSGLFRDFLRAYRVPREPAKHRAAETADTDAAAKEVGEQLVPTLDTITANDYILVVQLQQAAPSSTTGKCPNSIVLPSVARSSLTWSLCFVAPLCMHVQEVHKVVLMKVCSETRIYPA
jgi:hypothetical protein